jgi:RHS repeat-associated protein
MTTIGTSTPSYDANGNVLNDFLHTYTWDVDGRPLTIDGIGATYDALGRMVELNRSGTYTEIAYTPAGDKLALMSGQSLLRAFVPLPGGATAVYTSGGLDHYRHADWLGSARLETTPSRTVYGDVAYAPYGETYAASGTTDFSWTGINADVEPANPETLYDFPAREYGIQGRWPSPDPAGLDAVDPANPQSWNRYAYVENDPIDLADPSGLCPVDDFRIMRVPGTDVFRTLCATTGPHYYPGGGSWSGGGNLFLIIQTTTTVGDDPPVTTITTTVVNLGPPAGSGGGGGTSRGDTGGSPQSPGPTVPVNPCQYQGRALSPSDYATSGKAAKWYSLNFILDALKGWQTGHYLDAQPLTNVPGTWNAAAYGNYAYGVYMQAAGVSRGIAMRGAEAYAVTKTYPTGTPMQPYYPGLPSANATNIANGYNAQANGSTCHN